MNRNQKDYILGLIDNDETKSGIQKSINRATVERLFRQKEDLDANKNIIEKIDIQKNSFTILYSDDKVMIYKLNAEHKPEDDWDRKYPYRFIYFQDENWYKASLVCKSFEEAFVSYLGTSNLGPNGSSAFVDFVFKMLGKPIIE